MTVFSEIDSKEYDLICAATWYKLENMSDAEKNEILFDIIKEEYERESIFSDIVNRIISDVGENNFEEVAEEASCDEQETNLLIHLQDLKEFKQSHNWIIDDIFDHDQQSRSGLCPRNFTQNDICVYWVFHRTNDR